MIPRQILLSDRAKLRLGTPRTCIINVKFGDQWRNNSRKNEGMGPKQNQYPVVDVTGDRSKIRCCKEQYCIGTWNVRSMNQGKLEVVIYVYNEGQMKRNKIGSLVFNSTDIHSKVQNDRIGSQMSKFGNRNIDCVFL